MKALLLAAGLGTRLRPLTDVLPKCLAPIRGRPLLEYWLELLFSGGIREIIINTHYMPEMVKAYVSGSIWADRIRLSFEPELLGTGGTVLKHAAQLDGGPFLVAHSDNLSCFNITDFFRSHSKRPNHTIMTMMTFKTNYPESCGVIETDRAGIVKAFYEKVQRPPTTIANAAVYIVEPAVIDSLRSLKKENIDISTEIIPRLLGRISTFPNEDYHRDIGTIDSWRQAQVDYPHSPAVRAFNNSWNLLLDQNPTIARTVAALLNQEPQLP